MYKKIPFLSGDFLCQIAAKEYNGWVNQIVSTVKETYKHWSAQNPSRMAASLSYYAIFSMAPLFILLISIVGVFFRTDLAESNLLYHITTVAGSDITSFVHDLIVRNANHSADIISALLSFFILVFGATGVFKELTYSMDKMWSTERERKPRRINSFKQMWAKVTGHIPSLIIIIILTGLFTASIFSSISLQFLSDHLREVYPNAYGLANRMEPFVSFILVTIFFGAIYRILPKTKLPWNEILLGASTTALVFLIGEILIGYYLGHFVNNSAFGAAGSLITIMFWVYFSAQVFFFGAAFTFTYSKKFGHLKKLT